MKRIKSFLYENDPKSHTGLTIGMVIPPTALGRSLTPGPHEFSCIKPGIFHWVKADNGGYGWCELEDVPVAPAPRENPIVDLIVLADELGPRALRLLISIAGRLVKGAKEHGDFAASTKPMTREALEEHLDAVVYLAKELQDGEASRSCPEGTITATLERRRG